MKRPLILGLKLVGLKLALIAVTGVGVYYACADDAKTDDKATADAKEKPDSAATRVWTEGFSAMREMHAARLAIFNGKPEEATKLMQQATTDLEASAKDEAAMKDDSGLIAIDGSLALADTFVPSYEKSEHIAKANEHFKKGDHEQGLHQLRLGEIEVSFSRLLMPLDATQERLARAVTLANNQKLYEANLALKAAEDGLLVDTVSLIDFPKTDTSDATPSDSAKQDSTPEGDDESAIEKPVESSHVGRNVPPGPC